MLVLQWVVLLRMLLPSSIVPEWMRQITNSTTTSLWVYSFHFLPYVDWECCPIHFRDHACFWRRWKHQNGTQFNGLLSIVSSFWRSPSHRRIHKEIWLSIVCSLFSLDDRFLTDSSGTYTEYKAVSIGAGCEGATDMLKDLYKPVRFGWCVDCRISPCRRVSKSLSPHWSRLWRTASLRLTLM